MEAEKATRRCLHALGGGQSRGSRRREDRYNSSTEPPTTSRTTDLPVRQIGHHFFQVLPTPPCFKQARDAYVPSRRFRHLVSSGDVSLPAQYPTIRVGDAVQLFSEHTSATGGSVIASVGGSFRSGRDANPAAVEDESAKLKNNLSEPLMQSEQLRVQL